MVGKARVATRNLRRLGPTSQLAEWALAWLTVCHPNERLPMPTIQSDLLLLDAHARATRGGLLLDDRMPGWRDQIELGSLDVRLRCDCVVAQVTGKPYDEILYDVIDDDDEPAWFGFDVWDGEVSESGDGDPSPEYDALNAAWRLVVAGL